MKNKFITFFCAFSVLYIVSLSNVYATERHHHNYQSTTNSNQISSNGTALAIAISQISPELGSSKWQFGAGMGMYQGETAIAIGGAKRVGNILLNGSIGTENNKTGIGFGINLKF